MASIGDTTRPAFAYDQATDTWVPVGVGPHAHTPAAIGAIASSVVTTKGDLIVATGSGTVVRQGVGADGSMLVADSSQADGVNYALGNAYAAGKNKIINGDFSIWQRGTTFTNPSSFNYVADRWQIVDVALAGTITRQAFTPGQTAVPNNPLYFLRIQATTANTVPYRLVQKIENQQAFSEQTFTLSFWAKTPDTGSINMVYLTQDNFASGARTDTRIDGGFGITLTSSWQKFTMIGTYPSITGKTTNANTYASVEFYVTNGVTKTVDIANVQLEAGTVATPFQTASGTLQGELALCQRYYYRLGAGGGGNTAGVQFGYYLDATASSSTNLWGILPLPVTMRKTPSSVDYGSVGWITTWGAGVNTISVIAIYDGSNVVGSNPQAVVFQMTTTGATTNTRYPVLSNNQTAGYLGVSAEL